MSKSDLHKLGKTELLQIIYEQEKQINELKKEIADLNEKIDNRTIDIKEAGSIAEASLKINKIFEDAQKAADEYLNNIKKLGDSKQETTNITKEEENKDTIDDKEVENIELYIEENDDKENLEESDYIDVEFTEISDEIEEPKSVSVEKGYELSPVNLSLSVVKISFIKKIKILWFTILEKIKLKIERKKILNKIKQIGKEETSDLRKKEIEANIKAKIEAGKKNLSKAKKVLGEKAILLKDRVIKYKDEISKKIKDKDKKEKETPKNESKADKNKAEKNDVKQEKDSKKSDDKSDKQKLDNKANKQKKQKSEEKEEPEKKNNKNQKKNKSKKAINLEDYDLSIENLEKELNNRKRKESKVKFAKKLFYFGIVIVAFAIIIATRIFNVLQVSGDSMEPTLYPGNLLISTKIFGYEKGDIIAFYYNDSVLIKRVIATEGDTVYIDDEGNVYVNSEKLEEDYVLELSYGNCDITFPYRVPSGELFVLGDNREVSIDSRSKNIGTISEDRILGKIIINLNQFLIY